MASESTVWCFGGPVYTGTCTALSTLPAKQQPKAEDDDEDVEAAAAVRFAGADAGDDAGDEMKEG